MRSTLDIIDLGWSRLNTSPIKGEVNGGVYKNQRPLNSQKEDVVVGSLPVTGDQIQEGVMNVNIHVPNLVITIDGIQDASQPDYVRLKELTAMAVQSLQDYWADQGDVSFSVENQMVFEESEIKQHYSNIRLRYFAVNV